VAAPRGGAPGDDDLHCANAFNDERSLVMRALLVVIAMLFCSPAALAQDALEIPAEYKAFFDDYSALMKKYPAAAARFGMFDRRNPKEPRAANATPLLRAAFCSGANHCCTKWVDEGTMRCVQCSFCPP
jgi:hypothetical protein